MTFDIALDLFPITAAVLAVVTCGLLGNFLVLRRQSLMGDAISHAVLPGLVIAFLVTASRNHLLMFGGAAIAGVVTVVLIEAVKKLGRVEPGAAMGVVFSVMFALGVLMIEKAAARHVDLDAECVLYGQLETLAWFEAPMTWAGLWSWQTVEAIPRQVWVLLFMCALAFALVGLFFKELRIAAFDPELATSQGIHAGVIHYALMVLVAAATVASFEAVGSILVIAMLIAPAATARLLTDRLGAQIGMSVIVAVVCGTGGYFAATMVPMQLAAWEILPEVFRGDSVNAAGSMTLVAGFLVAAAAVFSPSHGLLARALRRRKLGCESAIDDVVATLYRLREEGYGVAAVAPLARRVGMEGERGIRLASGRGFVQVMDGAVELTERGTHRAMDVLRRHRGWEDYLVTDAGLKADHVHETAEQLEHLPIDVDRQATMDPHGKPIPRSSS